MWKTHARHLPLLCPASLLPSLIPAPSSFVVRLTPLRYPLPTAGIPPVQQKRYAKLFIRIAPQGELKGAGQAPRGVQQFKKICLCVCVWACPCVSEREWAPQGLVERRSQAKPCQAMPSLAQLMLIFCGCGCCCCCPRGNLNSAINVWVIRSIHDWYE